MNNVLLDKIVITDEDIDNLEKSWGDVTFDDTRRDIIKDLSSFDVQAFPGAGKTTVLIAKLAILAEKWPYTTKGICVLSHTNVAREEIEYRLGNTNYGRKLLSYPHFIGTIHSFMDSFIALPWMKSNGYSINVIDTEIAVKRRFKKLPTRTRDYYFAYNNLNEYHCEASNFPIELKIPCGNTTTSYKDLYKCIETSFNEGYFTFNELLYFSKYALTQNTELTEIVRNRFPMLFIDEAQDTDKLQEQLLDLAFGKSEDVIIQKFGDGNQAIYSSTESKENTTFFPNEPIKTILNSKRFSDSIAKLSDSFSVISNGMVGDNDSFSKNDSKHTIFLFEKDKIENVISEYGELVLNCFTDKEIRDNLKYGVHVVGMIHNKEPADVNDEHFPLSIIDYNKSYSKKVYSKSYVPKTMLEYYQLANSNIIDGFDLFKKVNMIADGLRRYINIVSSVEIKSSKNILNSIVDSVSVEKQMDFRVKFKDLLELSFYDEKEWELSKNVIKDVVKEFFGVIYEDGDFLEWNNTEIGKIDTVTKRINVVNYNNAEGRSVPIKFGSIHSVKGKTHLSTLVVETFWYDHNINSVLKLICGKKPKTIPPRNNKRMKIHYVGLTRAKGLICLALPFDSINDEQKTKLKSFGWNIKEIL